MRSLPAAFVSSSARERWAPRRHDASRALVWLPFVHLARCERTECEVSGKAPDRLAGDKSLGFEVHVHRASGGTCPGPSFQVERRGFAWTLFKDLHNNKVTLERATRATAKAAEAEVVQAYCCDVPVALPIVAALTASTASDFPYDPEAHCYEAASARWACL